MRQPRPSESIQQLRSDYHDRASFCCGEPSLDRYIQDLAGQEVRRKTAAVFVLTATGSNQILGYYSLSQSSIGLAELPVAVQKKLPRYSKVPATLMGRLAVGTMARGKKYGELLLMDALNRSWNLSHQIASFAMVVDVLQTEPDPLEFYKAYGFSAFPSEPRRVFLPFATYEKLFEG